MESAPHSNGSPSPATGSRSLQTVLLGATLAALGYGLVSLRAPEPPPLAASALPPAPLPTPKVDAPLPERLSETGLYEAGGTARIAPGNLFYAPQYPLWTDGAKKRRWISIPIGARIDASNPDAWDFPIGTRLWKEFGFAEPVETRYLERVADGSWRFATYVWDTAKGDAFRAPDAGVRDVVELQKGVHYDVPSSSDCRACHDGRRSSPVLGFNALQLSPDRDPLAPNREQLPDGALDLPGLLQRDLLSHHDRTVVAPRIDAPSPVARAAAGYLFGNCSHCHNREGSLSSVALNFDQSVVDPLSYERLIAGTSGKSSHFRLPGETDSQRIAAGDPKHSAVFFRMSSRNPTAQMPPLGTELVDEAATRLVRRWIAEDLSTPQPVKEIKP